MPSNLISSDVRILVVDDDPALNEMLTLHFEDQGYEVFQALDCTQALKQIDSQTPDVVLLDQKLPDGTGIELLKRLRHEEPSLAIIMMTGLSDLEIAIEAITHGAYDFIHKPIKTDELNHVTTRALEHHRLARQVAVLQAESTDVDHIPTLVGGSVSMLKVSKEIAQVAHTDTTVLIVGESGTGKELVARAIHVHSGRKGPLVAVNSAAIVDSLLESEFFGHEKGAFTGASMRKEGKFELARDGTLFLDEIAELPLSMQAKLLRVLQEHSFERVGGNSQIKTNARIIAATNRDLDAEVRKRRFRQDLLFRLKVLCIDLPPLRERIEDLPPLVEALLKKISRSLHKMSLEVSDQSMHRLQSYHWPGNVRELENALTQAAVRSRSPILTPDLFQFANDNISKDTAQDRPEPDLRTLDEVEASHVQRILDHVQGHKGRACEILGISRPALDRKIKKYDLRVR